MRNDAAARRKPGRRASSPAPCPPCRLRHGSAAQFGGGVRPVKSPMSLRVVGRVQLVGAVPGDLDLAIAARRCCPPLVTSMTWSLNWSLISVSPLRAGSPASGWGWRCFPPGCSSRSSRRPCPRVSPRRCGCCCESVISVLPFASRLAKAAPLSFVVSSRRVLSRRSLPDCGDLDDAVVVLVGDQDVAVFEQLRAVRVVELVRAAPPCRWCRTATRCFGRGSLR